MKIQLYVLVPLVALTLCIHSKCEMGIFCACEQSFIYRSFRDTNALSIRSFATFWLVRLYQRRTNGAKYAAYMIKRITSSAFYVQTRVGWMKMNFTFLIYRQWFYRHEFHAYSYFDSNFVYMLNDYFNLWTVKTRYSHRTLTFNNQLKTLCRSRWWSVPNLITSGANRDPAPVGLDTRGLCFIGGRGKCRGEIGILYTIYDKTKRGQKPISMFYGVLALC